MQFDGFESFEVSDFFGLLSTRRAFKFRRGKYQGSFEALGFGASLLWGFRSFDCHL